MLVWNEGGLDPDKRKRSMNFINILNVVCVGDVNLYKCAQSLRRIGLYVEEHQGL